MKPEALLQFSLALLFATIAYAQVKDPDEVVLPRTSDRVGPSVILCVCSESGRGFLQSTSTELESGMRRVLSGFDADTRDRVDERTKHKRAEDAALKVFIECIRRDGHEACVNADFKLRQTLRTSFCLYDKVTGKNLNYDKNRRFVTTGKCDTRSDTTSPAAKLPGKTPSDAIVNINKTRDEGCVAVEHLQSYVLQHRKHLLRPVLCSRGFCATPNHGIIVDGRMTSMKHLCSHGGWECTKQVKLVNNLKLSANRRAQVADNIIVTPYDVRFPKIAIWVVQMLEDILNLLASSVAVGAFAAASGIFFSKIQCHTGGRKKQ